MPLKFPKKSSGPKINFPAMLQSLPKQLLINFISECVVENLSLTFFATRDHTALGITIWDGSDRQVYYFNSGKEFSAWISKTMNIATTVAASKIIDVSSEDMSEVEF